MKEINQHIISALKQKAAESPRKRAHHNIHENLSDAVQRLFIAINPGSYIRPHRHVNPDKWECFLIFEGSAAMLTFNTIGRVLERTELCASGKTICIEITPGVWHTLVATSPNTILMEIKPGPYTQLSDKDFASWAPHENAPQSPEFEAWFTNAQPGTIPPAR